MMKRSTNSMAVAIALTMVVSLLLWTVDASARAGSGSSSGSRGSRSYSAPARPSTSPTSPSQPAAPSSFQQPAPQRSGWMGGVMGGLGGLLVGGLIGSMLFGGMMGHGGGLFGGIGLMEILIVAALAYFGFVYLRRRQASTPAVPPGYASPGGAAEAPAWRPEPMARSTAVIDPPGAPSDLERGLGYVRQMDPGFDPGRFADTASDIFFKVQAAWMGRDMGPARDFLMPEMHATLQKDCDRLRAERRVNRLESIAVRSVNVTEAWQEAGQDFVTVAFLASLLDYTTDESGSQLVAGSRTEPVKFEEYWTFTRPVGANPWKLSAIQQPQ